MHLSNNAVHHRRERCCGGDGGRPEHGVSSERYIGCRGLIVYVAGSDGRAWADDDNRPDMRGIAHRSYPCVAVGTCTRMPRVEMITSNQTMATFQDTQIDERLLYTAVTQLIGLWTGARRSACSTGNPLLTAQLASM